MSLDFIFVVLLAWFAFKGYRKGVIFTLVSFVAVFIAMLGALKFSGKVASYLFNSSSSLSPWIPTLSYLIVFVGILFIINSIAKMIDKTVRSVKLGWANKILGAAIYGVLVSFVWSSVLWLGNKSGLISNQAKVSSITYPYVEPLATKGFSIIGTALPFVKESYTDLGNIFDKINQKIP